MAVGQEPIGAPPAEPIEPDETMEQYVERREHPPAPETPPVAPAPSEPSVPPVAPVPSVPATPEPGAEPPAALELPKEEPSGVEKRISQLVARQREAERREAERTEEAAYWRAVAEGRIKPAAPVQPPPQPPQSGEPVEPLLDNFESAADFEAARTKYIVARAGWDVRQEQQAQRAREYATDLDRKHNERMLAAITVDPTLDEVSKDPTLPISQVMSLAIKESDQGPALVRYLANNRKEADRIAQLHPLMAAREMGRIEGTIIEAARAAKAAPPAPPVAPVTVSQAPEPVRSVGGTKGAAPSDDDDKLSIEEVIRKRNIAQYGKP